jgi:hypothetical protein
MEIRMHGLSAMWCASAEYITVDSGRAATPLGVGARRGVTLPFSGAVNGQAPPITAGPGQSSCKAVRSRLGSQRGFCKGKIPSPLVATVHGSVGGTEPKLEADLERPPTPMPPLDASSGMPLDRPDD